MADTRESKLIRSFPGFLPIPFGEKNEAGQLCAIPPEEVAVIVNKLTSSLLIRIGEEAKPVLNIEQISEEDLAVLNRFAATVAGVEDCKVRAVYGCRSCYIGAFGKEKEMDKWGTWVDTDCGGQCWYCCLDG